MFLSTCCLLLCLAEVPTPVAEPPLRTVEQIAQQCKASLTVITVRGRDGRREGLGTGFVLTADGLIATNFHVIGEGRAITVETADGKKHEVTRVYATDRKRDLAIVQIDAKGLPPLPLGDSETLREGEAVVALGNPQGLKHSVVSGVVSGRREIEGRSMIQLAIPLEPGNSGGPLVDLRGRVRGILTMKSAITDNLGFAAPINDLQSLLRKPNPVPMNRWLTIGALDPEEWKPLFGSRWTQRAGRILVEGVGSGFGGRSACIRQIDPPELPYELSVMVKLDDERGAAGLAFHHDAENRHYGFYPSSGSLRLTSFDGPDVLSWRILQQVPSPHYRPGEWNTLKVRVEKERIRCYVNDHLVIESEDQARTAGKVGLVKFRDTAAEFKQFRLGKQLPETAPTAEERKQILARANDPSQVRDWAAAKAPLVLREKARELEREAQRLKDLATQVHQNRVYAELAQELAKPEANIDLLRCVLLLAQLDNEDLDIDAYQAEVVKMARQLRAMLPSSADVPQKRQALNRFFFEERGFHGARGDYYNRSNSYLNEVIDDREGLPITLSLLYVELGRSIGLELACVGFPGHVLVRQDFPQKKTESMLIDVFEGGEVLSFDKAKQLAEQSVGEFRDEFVTPMSKKAILGRMFRNLLGVAQREQDVNAGLRYLDGLLLVAPDSGPDRFLRAVLRYQKGRKAEALEDVDYLLEHEPADVDLNRVRSLRRLLQRDD